MADLILSGAGAAIAPPAAPPPTYTLTLSGVAASMAAPQTIMPTYWTRVNGQWVPMVRFSGSEFKKPKPTAT